MPDVMNRLEREYARTQVLAHAVLDRVQATRDGDTRRTMSNKQAVIVDIDGTLADHNGRGPFDYDKCPNDLPIDHVANLVSLVGKHWGGSILLVSGRPDSHFQQTLDWLDRYHIPHEGLFMRTDGDYRPDYVIKEELYRTFIEPFYDVWFVLDDRNQTVAKWRELGLTCLQVADGDF